VQDQAIGHDVSTGGAGSASEWSADPATLITLRPIASPLALGFVGLAMGTTIVAALQLGWITATDQRLVAIALLAFVAPLQGLASIFGFLGRDGIAATGMGILAASWATVGWALWVSPPGSTSKALAIILFVSAASMLVPASTALSSKLVPALILITAAVRLGASGAYEYTGSGGWETTAGWIGVLLGVLALSGAWAVQLEDVLGSTVLPVGRLGRGRVAMRGTLSRQTAGLHHEAGVRQQL
jgi:succinate-acetate transporter protein